jgi:predicted phosphohydrolase
MNDERFVQKLKIIMREKEKARRNIVSEQEKEKSPIISSQHYAPCSLNLNCSIIVFKPKK